MPMLYEVPNLGRTKEDSVILLPVGVGKCSRERDVRSRLEYCETGQRHVSVRVWKGDRMDVCFTLLSYVFPPLAVMKASWR